LTVGCTTFTFPQTVSLMKNIKVIQHVHGIEHITDKLQTKSLEFTYEFIGYFLRKDSLTFDSKPP
jgi:hypothetical protein